MPRGLTKTKKVIQEQDGPYWVQVGTPNNLGPKKPSKTEDRARKLCQAPFRYAQVWCQRHNTAGLNAVDEALATIDSWFIGSEPKELSLVVDEATGFAIAVKAWKR